MAKHFGEKFVSEVQTWDTLKIGDEALQLFGEVAAPLGTRNDSFSDRARAAIYELKNLAVGRSAPEIVGEDIDGKPMKLSGFRGKVVVIDFWGHW